MTARRVAVTGIGVISALGHDAAAFWQALREGRSGIGPLEAVDRTRLQSPNAAEVRNFDVAALLPERADQSTDRNVQFALIAAGAALRDSGLVLGEADKDRTAVVTGCSGGGSGTIDVEFQRLYGQGKDRVHPASIPRIMANAAASHISMKFGLRGPAFNLSTACSSSNHALGMAADLVRRGVVEYAVAGGCEAPISLGNLKAWDAIRVVAPDTCRPFCKDRKGMILGEGAGFLVLEPLAAAQARGARVYAELRGFGMTADAHHVTQPSVDGPARAVRAALRDADLPLEAIGYINAHGTGTEANDVNEARVIRTVFGAHADRIPVSSTKSLHGHALGAAGALEAVATVLALHHDLLPPTGNVTTIDPACDIDVIRDQARPARVAAALSHSFAFGGLNAVLAFARAESGSQGRAS